MTHSEVEPAEELYRRSVVVVEDDAFMRSLIAEYLQKAGFSVSTAGNAAEVESKPGMGSNMLDACTLRWSRDRINEQTVLTAQLPIQV